MLSNGINGGWLRISLVALIATAGFFFASNDAQAQTCTGAPSGISCSCAAGTCGAGAIRAQDVFRRGTSQAIFPGVTCGSNVACLQRGTALCQRIIRAYDPNAPASCKTSCANSRNAATALLITPEPCSTGVCCQEAATGGTGGSGGCLNLPGVASSCKTTLSGTDYDLTQSTYWSTLLTGCASGQCTTPAGSSLCAAVAKNDGLSGTYTCVQNSADCETPLSASNAQVGSMVCGAQGQCCIAKAGATGARTTAKPATPKQLPDPLGGVDIPTFIGNVARTFMGIAGTAALLFFVYGGIMLIMSGGDSKKVQDGKTILVNASIGLVLIFSAYTFVSAIISAILAE